MTGENHHTPAPCDCASHAPLELIRKAINLRIRETPRLKKRLRLVAQHDALRVALYQCPECGQHWQSGHEWNFADQDYLFQVPPIHLDEWSELPYVQPASLLIYSAVMSDYFDKVRFQPSDLECASPGCGQRAVLRSAFCERHHVAALQDSHLLPPTPRGRMFPPYGPSAES